MKNVSYYTSNGLERAKGNDAPYILKIMSHLESDRREKEKGSFSSDYNCFRGNAVVTCSSGEHRGA